METRAGKRRTTQRHLDSSSLASQIIAKGSALPQSQSHLLRLPLELLSKIWTQLLHRYSVPGQGHRIDFDLLFTCRMVYLQAHLLPFSVNTVTYDTVIPFQGEFADMFDIRRLHLRAQPWQYNAIRKICLVTTQGDLESDQLLSLDRFSRQPQDTGSKSHPTSGSSEASISGHDGSPLERSNEITHLTVCLQDSCMSRGVVVFVAPFTHTNNRLMGLDPGLGLSGQSQPNCLGSMERATAGRLGDTWKSFPDGTWGKVLGQYGHLRRFRLILEANVGQKADLDQIVDCCKQWRFPLQASIDVAELKFDRLVEEGESLRTFLGQKWSVERRVMRWTRSRGF